MQEYTVKSSDIVLLFTVDLFGCIFNLVNLGQLLRLHSYYFIPNLYLF